MAKFRITMKDPDGVFESVKDAATESALKVDGLSHLERATLLESRVEEINKALSVWFEYAEYLTVEVDTDAGTCIVVPR